MPQPMGMSRLDVKGQSGPEPGRGAARKLPVRLASPASGAYAASMSAIRPFHLEIPEARLDDLRSRLRAIRWPERETVDDWSQGTPVAALQALVEYWADGYEWRACEDRLNRFGQFLTEIDGLDIHFLHVRSPHETALPLILTHGWPARSSSSWRSSLRLPILSSTAAGRRTPSTSSYCRCPATAFQAGRWAPGGAWSESGRHGPN